MAPGPEWEPERLMPMNERSLRAVAVVWFALLVGCYPEGAVLEAPPDPADDDDVADDDDDLASDDDDATPPADDDDATPPADDDDDASPPADHDDVVAPPHPTEPPPFPEYSEGVCPELLAGSTSDAGLNVGFPTAGGERQFRLLVPDGYDGSEALPLVIGWHWLNASSNSFIDQGEIEAAIAEMDFIALFPDEKPGDAYQFNWPFAESWGVDEELIFLDDMLACVTEQFNVDPDQVHGIGVSAGGLWITYVSGTDRAAHFASIVSLSGGLGNAYGFWSMEYVPQPRKFPAFVLSGGPDDWLGLDFFAASQSFRDALVADDHFVVWCQHDAGHAMPPMEPPVPGSTTFYALWQFMFDHPYGLGVGDSPYLAGGLPDYQPGWCEIW